MARIRITVQKYGKNRFRLSKKSVQDIRRVSNIRAGEDFTSTVGVNNRVYIPSPQKDGRAEIPRSMVSHAGVYYASVESPPKGMVFRRNYRVSGRRGIRRGVFYGQDIEDVDTARLKLDIIKDFRQNANPYLISYIRLRFMIEKAEGEEILSVKPSPVIENEKFLGYPEYLYQLVNHFIDDSFDEMREILYGQRQDTDSGKGEIISVIFLNYDITYENITTKPIKREAL